VRDAFPVPEDDRRTRRQQAEQVDHAVAWRHEEGDVVEAVAVNTPDQGAEDLEPRRDDHAGPHLQALLFGSLERREVEHREGEQPKHPLLPQRGDPAVGEKQDRRVGQEIGVQPVRP